MRGIPRFLICLLALVLCLASPFAAARSSIPDDVDGFTRALAKRFAKAMPDKDVRIKGPLLLLVGEGKQAGQVRLDGPWAACQAERRHCARVVREFVEGMAGSIAEEAIAPRREDLRVIVRGAAYADELRAMTGKAPESIPVYRKLADGLWEICVFDHPHGVATAIHKDVAKLGLTDADALAEGERNVATALGPLDENTHRIKSLGITLTSGNFYASSRMALHDSWIPVAERFHGQLLVAIPITNVLMFGPDSERVQIGTAAVAVAEHAAKPISIALYRWTPEGWALLGNHPPR